MVKHKRLKTTIMALGTFSVILFSPFWISSSSAYASSEQTVNIQAVSASTTQQKADKIIAKAESLVGKVSYQYGANNPAKLIFDCSAFMKYIYSTEKINLVWGSSAQSKQGIYVSKRNLIKGDLVFLSVSTSGAINHVGIYLGNGKFLHNTTGSVNGLAIGDLNSASYQNRYITARRVL